jgi:TolA-binding protein
MNLKKGLYKILYDNSQIDLLQEEEMQIEQLLNQYCQGSLDELNTEKINQIIKDDEDLAQKIANYKAILGGVETFFMQKSVANVAQNYFQEEKSKSPLHIVANNKNRRNRRLWLSSSAAAVVLMLIGFFVFPMTENETLTATDLYEKYSSEKPSSTTLGAENETIRLANQAYRTNNYSEAVVHFETHFKNQPQEPIEAFLYYGISLYRQNSPQYDKATEVFKQIMNANNYYSNLARWHLALQYLKTDNTTKAQQVLEELLPLTEAGSSRRGDVESILNSLKK